MFLNIWTITVIIENLAVVDRTIRVILIIKKGLPSVSNKLWGNCLIERNFILDLLLIFRQVSQNSWVVTSVLLDEFEIIAISSLPFVLAHQTDVFFISLNNALLCFKVIKSVDKF
jgi:hypothetical protein